MIFFFQAEDGIRDYKVTGVQTCALPIIDADQGLRRHRQHQHAGESSLAVEDGARELDRGLAGNAVRQRIAYIEPVRASAAMGLEMLAVAEKDAFFRIGQIAEGEPTVCT